MKQRNETRYIALQYLRAIAALSVVLHHSSYYLGQLRGYDKLEGVFWGSFGSFGVFVFFALSGFLMAVQGEKLSNRPGLFLTHRIIRVFPLFWIVSFVAIAVYWVLGRYVPFDPLTLTLAPIGERDYAIGVEWTLVYEVMFYVLIFVVIGLRLSKHLSKIAVAWIFLIGAYVYFRPEHPPAFPDFSFLPISSICAPFAFGLLVKDLLSRDLVNHSYLPIGVLLFTLGNVEILAPYANLLGGLGCALLVAWCAALSSDNSMLSPLLAKIGDWSFAIYLVHVPALIVLYGALPTSFPPFLVWIIAVSAAIAGGIVVGTFEVRMHQRLKAMVDRLPRAKVIYIPIAFGAISGVSIFIAEGHQTVVPDLKKSVISSHPLADDAIVGSIDSVTIERNGIYVTGWVNDPVSFINDGRIVLIPPSARASVLVPKTYRADVIMAFGLRHFFLPTGFRQNIPFALCPSNTSVDAFITSSSFERFRAIGKIACP